MSDKNKKNPLLIGELANEPEKLPQLRRSSSLSTSRESRQMRRISPLGMRVVVNLRPDTNQTQTGIFIPEAANEAATESVIAEVIEVASAHDVDSDEETNVSGIPLGALVLIPKDAGIKVPWDENLRVIDTKYVLAIINEIDIT